MHCPDVGKVSPQSTPKAENHHFYFTSDETKADIIEADTDLKHLVMHPLTNEYLYPDEE